MADVTNRQIESAMHWLAGLIGGPLDRRVQGFEQNPMLASYFRENFPLEYTLFKARKHSRKTGRFPNSPEYDPTYAFAVNAHRIFLALSNRVQRTFSRAVCGVVTNQHGARPLAFEIGMAVHFMRQGWDVEFVDYSGSGRFDFLIRRQGVEIEVELKSTSGDAGRKIHRREMNRLADLIVPTTTHLADTEGCHLLRVTIPDRLSENDKKLRELAALVARVAESKTPVSTALCDIHYEHPNISDWPDPRNGRGGNEFFEKLFGVSNQHILYHGREHFSVVAILVESSAPDQRVHVLQALAVHAKQAAEQCSGKRPAVIALQFFDPIAPAELEILGKTPSELHKIAAEVFDDPKRSHVDSIAFTAPQSPGQEASGVRRPSAPVVTLFNPNPLYPCPAARTLFRLGS
jgi:hypothetical protein